MSGNTVFKIFLSGGSSNQDPKLSKGGVESSFEYILFDVNKLFDFVDDDELSAGMTDYRIIYIRNSSTTVTYRSVTLYWYFNTTSPHDFLSLAFDSENFNQTAQSLALETDTPTIVDPPGWVLGENLSTGLVIGDFLPSSSRAIIIRRIVNPNADKQQRNQAQLAIEWDTQAVSIPPIIEPGPVIPERFVVAFAGEFGCKSAAKDILDDISDRKVDLLVSTGNNAYKSGSQCFLDILDNEELLHKTFICFGEQDVDSQFYDQPETKNALLNAFGLQKTYYTKIFKNIFFLIYDSESAPEASQQFAFMNEELNRAASNSSIEWIICVHNRPLYAPPAKYSNETTVRDVWHPKWDTKKVDFVFTARDKNIYVTKPITYDPTTPDTPIIADSFATDYTYNRSLAGHGIVFIGSGRGGKGDDNFTGTVSHTIFTRDSDEGFVLLDFQDQGKTAEIKVYDDSSSLKFKRKIKHT